MAQKRRTISILIYETAKVVIIAVKDLAFSIEKAVCNLQNGTLREMAEITESERENGHNNY